MEARELGNTCVIGLQWGDEGKGGVVDALAPDFDVVVRYSGGANAGHTIVVGAEKFALHQLPSGILHPQVVSMIACGVVLDPAVLLGEIEALEARGVQIGENLRVSDRAQLVFPYHRRQDILAEQAALPNSRIGTTARGVGPCHADKVSRRWGIRVAELYDARRFRARLTTVIAHKNAYLSALYDFREPFDANAMTEEYLAFAERLRPFVTDTTFELRGHIKQGRRVLFEGAQGALLDIDHGTYPYVTAAHTGIGGAATGAGAPPAAIRTILGVVKAYSTRVGAGPMPTELNNELGERIRELGGEFGTTTGRPRRCGWFDAVAAAYACMFNGPTALALTHLDTLSGFEELPVCVAYRIDGRVTNLLPATAYQLERAEPVYETLPGWREELRHCRAFNDLPRAAQDYVRFIEERLESPVRIIGVGPDRAQTIEKES